MNHAQIIARFELLLNRSISAVTGNSGDLANEVRLEICQFHNFSWMRQYKQESTVASSQNYSLPSDFKDELRVYVVENNNALELDSVDTQEVYRRWDTNDTGKPEAFQMESDFIRLWPIPDKVYTLLLVYFKYLADLSGSQSDILTTAHHKTLINGMLAKGYNLLHEDARELKHQNLFWYGQHPVSERDKINAPGGLVRMKRTDILKELPIGPFLIPRLDVDAPTNQSRGPATSVLDEVYY